MSFNINKYGVGRKNEAYALDGRKVYRADKILVMVGENIVLVDTVDDPDHFIYENKKLITKEEYNKYKSLGMQIPLERQRPTAMCTCGVEAVTCVDPKAPPEWQNKLMCRSVLQFGIHQTGMKIIENKSTLPDNIAQDKLMGDSDMKKLLKPGEHE